LIQSESFEEAFLAEKIRRNGRKKTFVRIRIKTKRINEKTKLIGSSVVQVPRVKADKAEEEREKESNQN
jgi:hypothetical protein